MNKHSLLLLFAICTSLVGKSQCPGPIVLATQAQVDAFPINWPNCTNTTSRFEVGAFNGSSDITDLTPLAQITGFGNHTYIHFNPNLTTLAGLGNVTEVMGDFTIQDNHALTNLQGLEALTLVEALLKIEDNNNLQTLNGLGGGFTNLESLVIIENDDLTDLGNVLDNLQTIDEYILFNLNTSLTSINTMNSLTSIGWYLAIEDNTALTSLNAFSSLENVGLGAALWDLEVIGHPNLTTLNDFANLSQIGENLEISENAALTEMSFPSLNSIGGQLSVTSNTSLTSLLGLGDFTLTGLLTIIGNSSLPECEAEGICDYLEGPGPVSISGNSAGCASVAQVEAACLALPVTLTFFKGNNDDDEVQLSWQTASEKNNAYFQVEHSQDGTNFKTIGRVTGNGTSAAPNNYAFRHTQPSKGKNFYRLKQVDFDSQYSYSHIVHVETARNVDVEIYPNPTTGYVKLRGELAEGTARLTDMTGRLIAERQLPEQYLIDLTRQPAGVYFIEIQMGGVKTMKRVVKQ